MVGKTVRIDTLRLVGPPGTNKVMAGELSRLSRRALGRVSPPAEKAGPGALVLPFDPALAHLAVHYHRTAARVLRDLYESTASRLEPLYDGLVAAVAADERPWARARARISVEVHNVAAFAAGERQLVGTVKNALIDGGRGRGLALSLDPERPDIRFSVRMHDDRLTVSIDLAGGPLHERGYRREAGPAPLRENLAATLVMLCRHDARCEPLLDPMAGAGTIAIEAALMARAAPLRPHGTPALAALPEFDGLAAARAPLFADTNPVILANEQDHEAAGMLHRNAERAGVLADIELRRGDFRSIERRALLEVIAARGGRAERGLIVSNPPYGERMQAGASERDLRALYRDLGAFCAQFRGWRAGFLVANEMFATAFGHRPRVRKPLRNGPLRAEFLLFEL